MNLPIASREFNLSGRFILPGRLSAPRKFWAQHREVSLNWIAFGLLLAAWNASDNDARPATVRRPEALRNHAHVSVRAVARAGSL